MTKVYITESGYKLNVASTLRMTASEAETLLDGVFEPVLGNPDSDGYVLSSTTAGVRSWVAQSGGGASDVGNLTTTSGSSTNMLRVAAAGGLEYRTTAQVLGDIGAAPTASPTFTGTVTAPTIVGGVIKPASDSTTALQLTKADGTTAVITVDTINSEIWVGATNTITKFGASALRGNASSAESVAIGFNAAGSSSPSTKLVAIGYYALYGSTTASNTVAIGDAAGFTSSGANCVAIGYYAGRENTGAAGTFLGYYQGYQNTTANRLMIGNNSTIALLDGIMATTVAASSLKINGLTGLGTNTTPTAYADIAASTTSAASLRIRSGTAPTTPNAGDIWNDGTDFNLYGSGLKLHSGVIKPASDSTTALQLANAAGTAVVTVDTTNTKLSVEASGAGSGVVQQWTKNGNTAVAMTIYPNGNFAIIQTTTNDQLRFGYNNQTQLVMDSLGVAINQNATPTAQADIAASTTAAASLRIRSGTAPTTPNSGDIWFDGTNLKMYDGTTTRTIFWT